MTNSSSIEEAEAKAVLMGLLCLVKLYMGRIILELDCLTVGRELQPDAQGRSPIFGLVSDIKCVLSSFESYNIAIVGRRCNVLAHEKAASARRDGDLFRITDVADSLRTRFKSECNPPLE